MSISIHYRSAGPLKHLVRDTNPAYSSNALVNLIIQEFDLKLYSLFFLALVPYYMHGSASSGLVSYYI